MSRISDLAGFTTALTTTEDLSVGVITASSFSGNLAGNATGLSGTPDITVNNVTGAAVTFTAITGALTGNATGLSGTPNITVGAVNASSGTISGNLSIGGTLTYQDVTNVDAVGMITARKGIQVLADGLDITGVSTFKSNATFTNTVNFNNNATFADDDVLNFGASSDGRIFFENSANEFHVRVPGGSGKLTLGAGAPVQITNEDGDTNRAVFTGDGVAITGVCTATSFSGSGENLTNLPASGDSNDITASLFI
jgi:hypothetical protein